MNTCYVCNNGAVAHITIRSGIFHEAQDQRDSTRTNIFPLCQWHYDEILIVLGLQRRL